MANTIKNNQTRELKKYLSKQADTIWTSARPRVKPTGTIAPAKKTTISTTLDPRSIPKPPKSALKKPKKKTIKRKRR
jgi:hypothetical protein